MQLYFKFTSNSIQSNEEEKAMISFFICLALLIGGYFVYGKVVENTFAPDDRETPAVKINDGVDYVVMPQWKLFLVQLLNIAGLGPIFGAMQGALWLLATGKRRYLPVVFMITSQECSQNVITELLFQKSAVYILADL